MIKLALKEKERLIEENLIAIFDSSNNRVIDVYTSYTGKKKPKNLTDSEWFHSVVIKDKGFIRKIALETNFDDYGT